MIRPTAIRRRDISKIFLETTIQIERFLETPERRTQILANLVDKQVCTSSYVQMEFQRTLLRDLSYVHSIVGSDCSTAEDCKIFLHDVMAKLRRRTPHHANRAVMRSLMVIERLLEIFEEGRIEKSRLLQYLADQIEDLKEEFLEIDLQTEQGEILQVDCSNQTDCSLVKTGLCHCRREEARCSLPTFLSQHAEIVERVRHAFEATTQPSNRSSSMSSAMGRVTSPGPIDWHRAKGQQNCWPLGDTIIALESPRDAAIYTTDRHYDVICPIVGRYLYEETAGSLQESSGSLQSQE
jgi:hypothetical protein